MSGEHAEVEKRKSLFDLIASYLGHCVGYIKTEEASSLGKSQPIGMHYILQMTTSVKLAFVDEKLQISGKNCLSPLSVTT